ncbi:MAG: cell division protein ZipA [Gammaproteobacteria bacterium]|nr:cell division protein ZipA [Gammaproteobacteria bacterium]
MSGFRWLLAVVGILILLLVFWISRRELSGRPPIDASRLLRRRRAPVMLPSEAGTPAVEKPVLLDGAPAMEVVAPIQVPEKILTVRLTGKAGASFAGDALLRSMQEAGLEHGRFNIFHRHAPGDARQAVFSVASLVEPGSFDLAGMTAERFPGITLFMTVPGPVDALAAFDDMLATARALATALDGELLDEQGSRLSVQRERFLRDELTQLRHGQSLS